MTKATLIHGVSDKKTRYQEIPKYQGGLYDLGNDIYTWIVPNGSWGESNSGLVVGEGESLLIDTLWDVRYTLRMLDAMQSIVADAPIKTLVNTHADGDHFWGNQLLADADIITSKASYEEMLYTLPKSMILLGRIGRVLSTIGVFGADKVGHWFKNMPAPYAMEEVIHTPAKRTFEGEMTLDIRGRSVELIEVGPAHTLGDLIVYIPDSKTIFSADVLFIGSTPVMWAGPVGNWFAALDRMLAMDAETIVPGHGPITDKNGVRMVRQYWEYVTEKLQMCFQQGMSESEAAKHVVLDSDYAKQPFGDWNSPERIMTNAHTLYREWQGRVDHPKIPELLNILRKQALLAHKLPDAQPQVMRKK